MPTTKKAPATVTVDRETLFDLVAAFTAMNQLMVALADGDTDFPFVDVFDSRLTVVEGWLGAASGEPDKVGGAEFPFDDPVRLEIGKAAAAITREMLKAIIADPYSELVPQNMTRPRLHKHQLARDAAARGGGEEWQKFFLDRRAETQVSAEEAEGWKRVDEKLAEVADQAARLAGRVTEMAGADA